MGSNPAFNQMNLVLIGGFAGMGKSTFAKLLSGETGWEIFDKDVVAGPFVEQLLRFYGADPHSRHSAVYREKVRKPEYQLLMAKAFGNLTCGKSSIVDAPFLREMTNSLWLENVERKCTEINAHLALVWVRADWESTRRRSEVRGKARDREKLSQWDRYVSEQDASLAPSWKHYMVDNFGDKDKVLESEDYSAESTLIDQARTLAKELACRESLDTRPN
jgi:predicted kinase